MAGYFRAVPAMAVEDAEETRVRASQALLNTESVLLIADSLKTCSEASNKQGDNSSWLRAENKSELHLVLLRSALRVGAGSGPAGVLCFDGLQPTTASQTLIQKSA